MISQLDGYLQARPEKQRALIKQAYEFARISHEGQMRFSGEPYISHVEAVAGYLASLNFDEETVASALLHDILEDTKVTKSQLAKAFTPKIAEMVDAVTKLSNIRIQNDRAHEQVVDTPDAHSPYSFERQLRILRKMFLAMADDIRVVLIKLADRRHNMQTLKFVPPHKQYRIARETLEIYAPLADRLGMGELKGELEDLAFPYVYPEEFAIITKEIGHVIDEQQAFIKRIKAEISEHLDLFSIKHSLDGRIKHHYSLYKKMNKKRIDLESIYDLVACRVIVNSVEECYMVLGIIHQLWKPLKGKIKDYIAVPKPNGYQSIHTTVFALDGRITEIQIRTQAMHDQAEKGVAAHWHYTGRINPKEIDQQTIAAAADELQWVSKLAQMQEKLLTQDISPEDVKIDFFQDRIFVFTPKGDVHDMPLGSTPIDFAYNVHTSIGNTCYGAKVNGKMVTLTTPLTNGDMVEILTKRNNHPKEDWLKFVKTDHARSIIKHYLKTKDE